MRDAGIADTNVFIKDFASAAVHVYSKFCTSGKGTVKFHNLDHILADVNEMGSFKFLSAGPIKQPHCLFNRL